MARFCADAQQRRSLEENGIVELNAAGRSAVSGCGQIRIYLMIGRGKDRWRYSNRAILSTHHYQKCFCTILYTAQSSPECVSFLKIRISETFSFHSLLMQPTHDVF